MIAYELIAKQYFYLSDMLKSSYYMDRVMRGKFEIKTSKVRELAMIQYSRKLESRKCKDDLDTSSPQDSQDFSYKLDEP